MAYSFIGDGKCLMVQEFIEMRHEHRFVVVGREIVTYSPVAYHLTPLARISGFSFEKPTSLEPEPFAHFESLLTFASKAAKELKEPDCILDVAISHRQASFDRTQPDAYWHVWALLL